MDSGNQSSIYIGIVLISHLLDPDCDFFLPSVVVSPVFDVKGAGGIVGYLIKHSY